mgnify:CR=1 FL=1
MGDLGTIIHNDVTLYFIILMTLNGVFSWINALIPAPKPYDTNRGKADIWYRIRWYTYHHFYRVVEILGVNILKAKNFDTPKNRIVVETLIRVVAVAIQAANGKVTPDIAMDDIEKTMKSPPSNFIPTVDTVISSAGTTSVDSNADH